MDIAFTSGKIDRADNLRGDDKALAQLRMQSDARLIKLNGLVPEVDEQGQLIWANLGGVYTQDELVFLGLKEGAPIFAKVPEKGDVRPAFEQKASRQAMGRLGGEELSIYGAARSLVDWHARHKFCANCGAPTVLAKGGWQRNCAGDAGCKAPHFPRVDPVAIMLVEYEGALLLGRSHHYPQGRYSTLAGFIEPGENIEGGVAREVMEEVGLVLRDVTYIASQPWPFPSQLMVGCHGFATGRELTIDEREIEDARWFTREEVAEAMANGDEAKSFLPPPPTAIAHNLLKHWLERA